MASADMLQEEGLFIRLDGDRILVESDAPLSEDQRRFFRQHRREIMAELRVDLDARVRAMAAVWRYDDQELADALSRAHSDPAGWLTLVECHERLDILVGKSEGDERPSGSVICGTCCHFDRVNHPHLGHCDAGEPEVIAGLWDTDCRDCSQWQPRNRHDGVEAVGR